MAEAVVTTGAGRERTTFAVLGAPRWRRAANRVIRIGMRIERGFRRAVWVALVAACFIAQAAPAAEVLECTASKETVGGRAAPAAPAVHMIDVDAFKDVIFFDHTTTLGLIVINDAAIAGWGEAPGIHGEEIMSLTIDRVAGTFAYSVVTDGHPQFSRRLEGRCAEAQFESQF